MKGLARCDLRK